MLQEVNERSPHLADAPGTPDRVIGRVVAVSGSQLVMGLEWSDENIADDLQIGTLIKLRPQGAIVFGIISAMSVPVPAGETSGNEIRIAEVELVGELSQRKDGSKLFQRGVSSFPTLGSTIYTASHGDVTAVYSREKTSNIRIGSIHLDPRLPAEVNIDDLLSKHFAILGATGSGKSCAMALILKQILSRHTQGHIVLLDIHNEYGAAFGNSVEAVDAYTLEIPYWLFTLEELSGVIFGKEIEERPQEATIFADFVVEAKRRSQFADRGEASVDTPIPYRMTDVVGLIEEALGRLDRPDDLAPYNWLKARLISLQQNSRYRFIFPTSVMLRDNMANFLSRLFRVPSNGKPMTVLDLSGIPSEILDTVVSVIARMAFDLALWSERSVPILLVCEEAHRYLPGEGRRGFEPTKRALSRIAKEGRKYGVSLCLVSQRPSELAPEVLSQCSTVFAMRMTSGRDQEFVRAAVIDSALGLLDFLPSLRNAEAVAVGEGVPMPMRITFDPLPPENRPARDTSSFSVHWAGEGQSLEGLQAIIARWRRQERTTAD